jgi:predicted GTPase
MGLSGINLVSASEFETSEQLDSCTQDVQVAPEFELDGRKIILIDTPGFDDTDRSEVEILKLITTFLADQ